MLDITSSTLNPIEALDNVHHSFGQKIVYKNELYYSKNFQLCKFNPNSLNINSLEDNNEFLIFPNPISDFISFSRPNDISHIKIYDLNGKLVFEEDILSNNRINIENLNSETYIIKIVGKNGSVTNRKILKK